MIKLLAMDMDGTLTDGRWWIHDYAEGRSKAFHTRDFHGMSLVKNKIGLILLTASTDRFIEAKFRGYDVRVHTGVKDKFALVDQEYIIQYGHTWSEIAFIGDDEQDMKLLSKVGLAACPADAEEEVIRLIETRNDAYVMTRNGGFGCVREFINLIRSMYNV